MNDLLPLVVICGLVWVVVLARLAHPVFVHFTLDAFACALKSAVRRQWGKVRFMVRVWCLFLELTPAEMVDMAAILIEHRRRKLSRR